MTTRKPDPLVAIGGLMLLIPIILILGAVFLALADAFFGRTGLIVAAAALVWFIGAAWRRRA